MNKKLTKALSIGALASSLFISGCDLNIGSNSTPVWLDGIISPTSDQGKDGDFYLDTTTQKIYKKSDGEWKLISEINKENGDTWFSGESAPSETLGKDGNFYFDTQTEKVYKKENGEWVLKSFVGQREIEKIELVETGVEYDVYKITYTNGETETFDVLDKEKVKEKYTSAVINTRALQKYSYTSITRSDQFEDINVTSNGNEMYYSVIDYKESSDSSILGDHEVEDITNRAIIKDVDLGEYVEYKRINDTYESSLCLEDDVDMSIGDLFPIEIGIIEYLEMGISELALELLDKEESHPVNTKTSINKKEESYQMILKAEASNNINKVVLTYEIEFGDYIESMKFNAMKYDLDGENNIVGEGALVSFGEILVSTQFNESMKITDFSEYPNPVIGTYNILAENTLSKIEEGFTARERVDGAIDTVFTGDSSELHIIHPEDDYESHYIKESHNVWNHYFKDEDGGSIQENKDDEWVNGQNILKQLIVTDINDIWNFSEVDTEDTNKRYNYSIQDGKLIIGIVFDDIYVDSETTKKFSYTCGVVIQTTENMDRISTIYWVIIAVEVDDNGSPIENGETVSNDLQIDIQYSMDEDLIESFDPSDYTNND